ncbi:MAG TPA: hypothetical protein VKB58_14460 [Terriglobales bacterium]|nr:hypothetical protein [Terriglobales bacterium]
MRKVGEIGTLVVFILLTMAVCLAQGTAPSTQMSSPAASASTQGASASAAEPEIRGSFGVSLIKPLDSKKMKDGDQVICQTSGTMRSRSGLLITSGTKVIGHITQAKARSKGDSDSTLGIVFDKIEVSKEKEIPFKGVLQAVGPSLGSSGPETSVGGGAGMMAGHGGSSTMGAPASGPGMQIGDTGSHPMLNSQSVGVLGIRNLQMDKDSVLTSTGKEVKLDLGTQMMIRAEIAIPVQ